MTTYKCERCGFISKDIQRLITHLSKYKECPSKRGNTSRKELLKHAEEIEWDLKVLGVFTNIANGEC